MRLSRSALAFLMLAWVLVMLYPDPGVLVRSARNVIESRPDPAAAKALAASLPDDPALIEAYVIERHLPYSFDWQAYGVPWYFPTAAEALSAGRGDCESRAIALASILAAKGIPFDLRMAFGHIWVDYPGKAATLGENAGLEIAGRREGRLFFKWPENLDVSRELSEQLAIHYEPAPPWRVYLLVAGLTLLPLWNAAALRSSAGAPLGGVAPARRRARRSPAPRAGVEAVPSGPRRSREG